jgi:hypothetical protein
MKAKVISIFLMLAFMAVLPFVAAKFTSGKAESPTSSQDTAVSSDTDNTSDDNLDKEEILCGLVAAQNPESYCDEAIKAMIIILNTNYNYDSTNFDLNNSNVYISKDSLDNSNKELYSKIEELVNSAKELYLYNNDKICYIPFSKCSNGSTIKSEDYDYLCAVASPWDCFSSNYTEDLQCEGVSLDGVNYLCEQGLSAQEAISWYLPDFYIGNTVKL